MPCLNQAPYSALSSLLSTSSTSAYFLGIKTCNIQNTYIISLFCMFFFENSMTLFDCFSFASASNSTDEVIGKSVNTAINAGRWGSNTVSR